MKTTEEYLASVLDMKFGHKSLTAEEYVDLLREHVRRSALWADRLSVQAKTIFWDIPKSVDLNVRANPKVINSLNEHYRGTDISTYHMALLELSFHWTELESRMSLKKYDLPDPYEPFVQFHLQGGWFRVDDLYFEILGSDRYILIMRGEISSYFQSKDR